MSSFRARPQHLFPDLPLLPPHPNTLSHTFPDSTFPHISSYLPHTPTPFLTPPPTLSHTPYISPYPHTPKHFSTPFPNTSPRFPSSPPYTSTNFPTPPSILPFTPHPIATTPQHTFPHLSSHYSSPPLTIQHMRSEGE